MKLKGSDKVKHLFVLYGAGIISQKEIESLVDTRNVNLGSHLSWTLEEFSTLTELKSDIEIVSYILKIRNKNLSLFKRLFIKKNVLNMRIDEYLSILKFAIDGVKDINAAISNIKQPTMSTEMQNAGFGKLNFGDLGMARTVGGFENIGTIQAYSLQMHIIIKSLEQLAAIKVCEKNHQEILEAKSKTIRK